MNSETLAAIEVFKSKIKQKEDELNRLKSAVNDMVTSEGGPPVYHIATTTVGTIGSIRSDQFYGQALAAAIRQYLEMRKASGLSASSVNEIFEALKQGGYKFDTKDDENAKAGVRQALRKNSAQFHRLPNGEYGLLSWYPNAKPDRRDDDDEKESNGKESESAQVDSKRRTSSSDAEQATAK